jgi:dephospho-CoA kinase
MKMAYSGETHPRKSVATEDSLLKVGLTGGIASGKSVVGEMFARFGAHVVQADVIAHELMQPGQAVYTEVVRQFGNSILNSDGSISRSKLAEVSFGSKEGSPRIETLNRIVHPAVIRRQEEWMDGIGRRDHHAVAIVEAALILEAGAARRFDRLVVVTCAPEQRVQRWAIRLHIDAESARREITRRMAAQLPEEEKIRIADYVIDNSGSVDETERQVRAVYSKLAEESAKNGGRTGTQTKTRTTEN